MVNPRHQTPQGQSVAKPGTLLQNILDGNLNMTQRSPKVTCSGRYSDGMSRGKNIQGGVHLQNQWNRINSVNSYPPEQNGKITISQVIILNAFSWMKSFVFWLEFHWILFPRVQLTTNQHWFRQWLGAEQATSHYLNQCWRDSLTDICGIRRRRVNSRRAAIPREISPAILNDVVWSARMYSKSSI